MCAVQMPTVKVEALWLRLFVCRIINDLPLILHKCQGQADRKQTGRTLTFGIGQAGSRSRSLLSASRQTEVNNQYHLITLITLFCAALLFFHSHFFFAALFWAHTLSHCDSDIQMLSSLAAWPNV